jgi:hypothetical protein
MFKPVGMASALLLFAGHAQAADKDKEPLAIFEIGGAGEWSLQNGGASLGPSKIAAEFALDFMFWPWPDRKLGWFLEPTYSYSFSKGHEQATAVSVGLLIPIP